MSALTALALALALLSACASQSATGFPAIFDENPQITLPGGASTTPTPKVGPASLSVGIPSGSSEMLTAVSELYNGMTDGRLVKTDEPGSVGARISLDDLAKFTEGLNATLVDLPTGDALRTALLGMGASGTLPDIYLTDELPALSRAGYTTSLDGWASVESLLQEGKVLPVAFQSCIVDGKIQGLPYSASTPVLFYNATLIADAGIDASTLDAGLSLRNLVALFPALTKPTTHQYALYDALPLLSLLPSTRDVSAGWSGFVNGSFDFGSQAFTDSVTALRAVVKGQWTLDLLTKDQLTKYYSTSDPRILGKIAFWIDDSSRVSYWTGVAGLTTGIAPIPYLDERRLPLSLRCFAVNPKSTDLPDAVRFTGFLATDADALRLESRFGFDSGRIPLQLESSVWTDAIGQGTASLYFTSLRSLLPKSFVEGRIGVPGWSAAVAASLDAHALKLLQGLESIQTVSADMDAAARKALSETSSATPGLAP